MSEHVSPINSADPTDTTSPLMLSWVDFADVIETVTVDGVVEPHFVLHACGAPVKAYYCTTDRTPLANVGNLLLHLESGGVHRIAVYCPKHRVYEAAEQSQVDAFAAMQRNAGGGA